MKTKITLAFITQFALLLALVDCRTTRSIDSSDFEAPVLADEPWRNVRPEAGTAKTTSLPIFEKTVLANGLTLMVVHDNHLPIVDVRVVVLAGSARDALSKDGQSELCFNMLDEGAGDLDALSLTTAFADLGTQLVTAVGQDAGMLQISVLSQHLNRSLELLHMMVQKPLFHDDDFIRVRNLQLSSLQARQSMPAAVGMDAFLTHAYGKSHPYGHSTTGSVVSVQKMTRQDVEQFWRSNFAPNNTAIVLSGDVTLDDAKRLVEAHFGKWQHTPVPAQPISPPSKKKQTFVELIPRSGSPQTFLVVGRPLLSAKDKNEFALDVFNEILGGMFTSRLNMNLREGKSWTYGVQSSITPLQNLGPFMARTSIQVPYAGPALGEMMKEFDRMKNTDVSDAEMRMAKDGLLKSFPGRFETINAISSQAAYLFVYDLPLDYFDRWQQEVSKVSVADVKKMAKMTLDMSQMTIIAVGDLDAMKKPIEELKLGVVSVQKE